MIEMRVSHGFGGWAVPAVFALLSLSAVACDDAKPGSAPNTGGAGGSATGGAGGAGGTGGTPIMPGPPGSLDATFGNQGVVTLDLGGIDTVWSVATDATNRVVLAGNSNAAVTTFAVARLLTDGTPDMSFGTFGTVATSFNNNYDGAEAVFIQDDGRIVVAGSTLSQDILNGVTGFALARYVDDGSLDSTFGSNGFTVTNLRGPGGTFAIADGAARQGTGRIVVLSGGIENLFVGYTATGVVDTSFGFQGSATSSFSMVETGTQGLDIAMDSEDRILVAGRHIDDGDISRPFVARFTPTGGPDTNFGTNGYVRLDKDDGWGTAVASTADRVYLAGRHNDEWLIAAFDNAGNPVADFGTAGEARVGQGVKNPRAVVPLADGGLVVVGSWAGAPGSCPCTGTNCDDRCGRLAVARLSATGELAADFAEGAGVLELPIGGDAFMTSATVDSVGRLIVGGHAELDAAFDFVAVRIWL